MIRTTITPRVALTPADREAMWQLFARYYDHVERARFEADLEDKDHVFVFRDGPTLAGFSTILRRWRPELGGTFMFSGDTVIDERYWGGRFLQAAFLRYIVASKLRTPLRPLYWLLISKGYKTYLMMRRNFWHSYPNHLRPTPPRFAAAAAAFYAERFGAAFDPARGLVVHERCLGAVKGEVAVPDTASLADPEVRFFVERNPGYAQGHELACIAEIRFADFGRHVLKYVLRPPRHTARATTAGETR